MAARLASTGASTWQRVWRHMQHGARASVLIIKLHQTAIPIPEAGAAVADTPCWGYPPASPIIKLLFLFLMLGLLLWRIHPRLHSHK